MFNKFEKVSEVIVDKNPYWEYIVEDYVLPNKKIAKYYYVHTLGSIMIIPMLEDNRFILTKQYRYLNKRESLEFPGGGVKKGFTIEESALNELIEETGYKAGEIKKIGHFNPCNGLTDEICNVFIASNLEKFKQKLDESEEISVCIFSYDEIIDNIKSGTIWDGMTLASWSLFTYCSI
ncbi:MAG: NUDIX hydrolase [Ignavibacteria bacterium]|nr:NUDIX hydrolase [Ignavibacteria bacterium]